MNEPIEHPNVRAEDPIPQVVIAIVRHNGRRHSLGSPFFLLRFGVALDLLPFLGAVAMGSAVAARLFHARVNALRIWCISYSYAACALVGALGTAHLVSIVSEAVRGPFVYDFRSYALILLGLLFIVPGHVGVVAAGRSLDAKATAVRQLCWVWGIILCVDLPLIPLQGFAVLFSVLGCLGLVGVWCLHNASTGEISAT